MPIINREDAVEVADHIDVIFGAGSSDGRAQAIRELFTRVLDFEMAFEMRVDLKDTGKGIELPRQGQVVAELEGVQVVYVDISEVTTDTDRVRKAEAQEAARLISEELGGELLLVFTNRSCSQLHFVLPSFAGRNPSLRRMVIERDLPRRTAIQQLSNVYWEWRARGNIRAALDSAFDVEAVTDRFFREYKKVFDGATEKVTGFGDDNEAKNLFVQTLFNRLMFIYFLSRKGWLRFGGKRDYLKALWKSYASDADQTNFYRDRLTHLFFVGLNNPTSRDLMGGNSALSSVIGDVPFLNGGLFDKEGHDDRSCVVVPDDAIEPIFRDLFDRFNFTVMESTPLDVEVAVDPEMLGKVFEELVTGRHESGSYYTPRPVVSFMCREALKGYLAGRHPEIAGEAIRSFVEDHDTSCIPQDEAPAVGQSLVEITVVDPACGSGAYLLGMMQELVDLRSALYSDQLKRDAISLYRTKLSIIERNLYGADIDGFAVNIAMLRLWLSLVIEYEGDHPEPLPNLDYKIVCGDSLLGADPSPGRGIDFYRHETEQLDLRGKKARYMRASDFNDKKRIESEIEDAVAQIRKTMGDAAPPEGVVDWSIDFADVFALNRGFDVVVANPPYVESRSSSIKKTSKAAYAQRFLADWGVSLPKGSDLFIYFFARAAQLLSTSGKAAFITQNGWLSSNYGKAFQDFTVGRFSFSRIVDTESRFFAQSGGPNINAVISFFDHSHSGTVKYQMVDGGLVVQSARSVSIKGGLKWGHLFAMPDWFQDMLREMTVSENLSKRPPFKFGQGINVPKGRLNASGADIGIIAETPNFGCFEPDSYALRNDLSEARLARAPALMMPRGVGRYYCSFNKCQAFSYSGVELYLPADMWETDVHYCLWLYLNSSFAWLFREITGRKNLGGGMLKAEATDMKRFPSRFDFDFGDEAREVFSDISNKPPLAIADELKAPHHLRIDEIIGNYFGITDRQDDIRGLLIEKVGFRGNRAQGV